MILQYVVNEEEDGKKLISVLHGSMRLSYALCRRLKFQTKVYLDGKPVFMDVHVAKGQRIQIPVPEETADFPPEPGPLTILYEDEALLALQKPSGIIIHPSATRNTGTLANRVLAYLGGGAVHPIGRLDRDTTGVCLFAKNGVIASILGCDQQKGKIKKTYQAVLCGKFPQKDGVIDLPIDRLREDSLWRTIRDTGLPSRTAYHYVGEGSAWTVYNFTPITGRTHQIRVHCWGMGVPILGDPVYYNDTSFALSKKLALSAQLLCCTEMTLRHPLTGEIIHISCRPEYWSYPWFYIH